MAEGLVAGTRVMTLDGELPVEFLTVGDRLITRSGTRRLLAVTRREVLRTELVEIPADTLGKGRPIRDMDLGADQRILVLGGRDPSGHRHPQAVIPAGRIARHCHLECTHRTRVQIHMLQLETDQIEIIFADGLQIQLAPGNP
ncbi:hypothetical protein FGG78_39445 [Thioclava sp. BHET1]|nr:hypothetical protein FGG78_39445 [Thioclava sp. BHET1]